MRRRAFTLLELLVVLGIIGVVAGLVLFGIVRSRRVNVLVATQQLVTDLVRQARHTARSTGSPVVLRVERPDTSDPRNRAMISGVSRICLWSESFEPEASGADGEATVTDLATQVDELLADAATRHSDFATTGSDVFRMPGQSGLGWLIGDETADVTKRRSEGLLKGFPLDPTTHASQAFDNKHNVLLRRDGEGFYLHAAFRPPPVRLFDKNQAPELPVITLGTSDAGELAGIVVQWQQANPVPKTGAGSQPILFPHWEILGWTQGNDRSPALASALKDPNGPSNDDIANPSAGDEWVDLGLLYDGRGLAVLYRDGAEVARANVAAIPASATQGALVWVGRTGGTVGWGAVDNVALYRLAVEDAGALPPGVTPDAEYRIVAHPDGRIEATAGGAALDAMLFAVGTGRTEQRVRLNLSITGTVKAQPVLQTTIDAAR